MFGVRSARRQALLASLLLLLILGGISAVAVWRVQSDRAVRKTLERRATVVAAFEKARSEMFRSATLMTAAVFAEDATPFVDSWRQAVAEGDQQLLGAQVALTELGDKDTVAALDSFTEETRHQAEQVQAIVDFAVTADVSTRIDAGQQQYAPLWAETQA